MFYYYELSIDKFGTSPSNLLHICDIQRLVS